MKHLFLFLFLSTTLCLSAQKTYNGKVVDMNNIPLEGISVVIEGTSIGTTTNNEGDFSVSSNHQNTILVFSALGFKTQKQQGGSNLKIILQESSEILSEVVLVGTRNPRQTKLETPVAVDIVNVSKIKLTSAQTTANDLFNKLIPNIN